MKEKLLVSFSGGETSAYMAQWLWRNNEMKERFDMMFVFANTGQENEETLIFIEKCEKSFGFPIFWVEANVFHGQRKGSGHRLVTFETASRNGEPFEDVIKKYGIPNQGFPHCTRETKLNPIKSFAKKVWGKEKYYTAIGIRIDESDRMNEKAIEQRLMYPLINKNMKPMTKPKINFWWSQQPFRLNLKGYQGNCKTCWKKSDKKLFQIAKESPEHFEFMSRMENRYPRIGAEFKKYKIPKDRTFFRGNRSAKDILKQSEQWDGFVHDDSEYKLDLIGGESCEIFSSCGD